jgi:hypothetical protein
VAGALLGAHFGANAIPQRWLEPLAARDEASALADRLIELARRQASGTGGGSAHPRAGTISDPAATLRAALKPFDGRLEHDPGAQVAAEAAIAGSGAFRTARCWSRTFPRVMCFMCSSGAIARMALNRSVRSRSASTSRWSSTLRRRSVSGSLLVTWPDSTSKRAPASRCGPAPGSTCPPSASRRDRRADRTPDRVLFDAAADTRDPQEALELWEACLGQDNELARYALGYTLLGLGRACEAHKHLRRYSALVRRNAWAWCYLGRASEELDDLEGAEYAYRQALEATAAGSFETDAAPRLASLLARLAQAHGGGEA